MLAPALFAAGPGGFLRSGDRWAFAGDSITHNDLYRQLVELGFCHFHPGEDVSFEQRGAPGIASGEAGGGATTSRTDIASVMLGMNNYINGGLRPGMDIRPFVERYRSDMEARVRQWREAGASVLLLSPTLTDESFGQGFYELRGSSEFLRACGRALWDIAAASGDGVYYVPVQEEFEAFQNSLAPEQTLRLDGVHPSALGQYQIARTLWERLDLAGPMAAGERRLGGPWTPLAVSVRLASRFLTGPGEAPRFVFSADTPVSVRLGWSLGRLRGSAALEVGTNTEWSPPLPAEALPGKPGELRRLMFDLAAGEARSLYVTDLCRVPVRHPEAGRIVGDVAGALPRPEGARAGTWCAELTSGGLLFSGEVTDSEIRSDQPWPWARDGVDLYLDLRPPARFADIGFDSDVHIAMLKVSDRPRFACTLIPWAGRGMQHAAEAGAARTTSGYLWNLHIRRPFGRNSPFRPGEHELVGFNMIVVDEDTVGAGSRTAYARAFDFDRPIDKMGNAFMVLDFGNRVPGDSIVQAHLFGR